MGGKYLCEKKIKIIGNVINPLPDDFSGDIMNITDIELGKLCIDVLKNKIDVESRFVSVLFDMCLFSGYYFSALDKGTEISNFCYEVLGKVYKMFASINLEIFAEAFTRGYKTNSCENYVRKCFYDSLSFELEKGIPFIEAAKTSDPEKIKDIDKLIAEEKYCQYTKKINNKMQKKTSIKFLQRLAITYWKNNNDPELSIYISKIKAIFDEKMKLTALQDYFYDMLVDIMTKGAALQKNDLLDAIILCNVQDKHMLITYDNGVIKRMEKRKNKYPRYLESIKIIEKLKE